MLFGCKNDVCVDVKKRNTAASFLLLLNSNNMLFSHSGNAIINNENLASMTLFFAASK